MPKRIVELRERNPLLDVVSFGRRGPGHRSLTSAEIEHISRTVRRVPEVMIKVSGGARTLRGVERHLDYIGREGKGEIETDQGERLQEKGFEKALLQDWDLDLEAHRRHTQRAIAGNRKPPKLVHNIVFSMPRRTPPDKLLQAVRKFAREKFALQHRYAMGLHTDQGHPHVHVVVKAMSERGVRLNIRKATLREWRREFARYLRELGIEANATERAVRGQTRATQKDGIYRAALRGDSTHVQRRQTEATRDLAAGRLGAAPGDQQLRQTRSAIVEGWKEVAAHLRANGHPDLANRVHSFAHEMPPALSDQARLAELARQKRAPRQHRDPQQQTR